MTENGCTPGVAKVLGQEGGSQRTEVAIYKTKEEMYKKQAKADRGELVSWRRIGE